MNGQFREDGYSIGRYRARKLMKKAGVSVKRCKKFKRTTDSNHKLWIWDYKSIEYELARAGFADIRRCVPGSLANFMMIHVEKEDRFMNAVAVECKKP